MKILIIDNYDSYTYNLFQLISQVNDGQPIVIKNDQMTFDEMQALDYDAIVISPGPGTPKNPTDFGLCRDAILHSGKPILGVCLGQQGIYYLNGGNIVLAPCPMHGRLSAVQHNNQGLFEGIPQNFKVTRYHSLVCEPADIDALQVDAWTEDGIIMGISHKTLPQYAVQFHPESIASEYGREIVANFLDLAQEFLDNNQNTPGSLYFEKNEFSGSGLDIFDQLYRINPQTQWLDSSLVKEGLSRFSIIGQSSPKRGHHLTFSLSEGKVSKKDFDGTRTYYDQDIFSYLADNQPNWPVHPEIPCDFQLGYIGYFGYELKSLTEGPNRHQSPYPDSQWDFIDRAIIIDHQEKMAYCLCYSDDHDWIADMDWKKTFQETEIPHPTSDKQELPLSWAMDRETYIDAIHQCQEFIRQGESYELCLTNQLRLDASIEGYPYYRALRQASPGPYSAFLNFDKLEVASSSMEKFLTLDRHGVVTTKPIKGTAKRGSTSEEDQAIIYDLSHEEKTMAENLMIGDLLRNDLGKVCQVGSVQVPHLMAVETYSTLHQLVTTVQGQLTPQYNAIDLVRACFPGGSMTGAPKYRSLELIDQLETQARGIYSGTIGYLSNNGCLDLNIVIRTAVITANKTTFGMGGAIIALSDPQAEFEEIQVKAQGALNAMKIYKGMESSQALFIKGS